MAMTALGGHVEGEVDEVIPPCRCGAGIGCDVGGPAGGCGRRQWRPCAVGSARPSACACPIPPLRTRPAARF